MPRSSFWRAPVDRRSFRHLLRRQIITTPQAPDRLAAALADRYRIDREVGQGGMATVYLAYDIRHDRKVAIKVLRPELAAVIGAERFLSEIKTTANLQHPHILPLFDSGAADSYLFYVMPFIDGVSLRGRLAHEHQLPISDAVRIATEVASALDSAHRHGIIHRDIKPENILLHDGSALVADFGIALAASKAGSRMTETGMSLGTPHYMSPEQAMGEREITARSDIYALGCVTYEMLTGDPPFTGSTAQAIVAKVMTEKPVPPSRLRDTIPDAIEDAVLTALQKLPADRFGSAREFGEALRARDGGSGSRSPGAVRRPPRVPSPAPRFLLITMGTITAAALGLAAWGWLRRGDPAREVPPSRLAVLTPGLGPPSTALQRQIAITPDGATLIYMSVVEDGFRTLRRHLDDEVAVPIPGVPEFVAGYSISPNGAEFVGVVAATQEAYRFPIEGGNGRALSREIGAVRNPVTWTSDGSIWFDATGDVSLGIGRLGPDNRVTRPFAGQDVNLVPMQVLPGDRKALVLSRPMGASTGPVHLLDLESGESTLLLDLAVVQVRYTVGHLVYALTNGALEAIAFDPERGEVSGRSVAIASGVSLTGTGVAQFDVSATGTVVYVPEAARSLVLVDRAGGMRDALPDRRNFHSPRFAPGGGRIAVDFTTVDGRDIWLADLATGALTRATFVRDGHDASWGPGENDLSYISAQNGVLGIWRVRPGSTEPAESLLTSTRIGYTGVWLKDRSGLVTAGAGIVPEGRSDIGLVRNGGRGPIEPLVATRFDDGFPAISPDNRWLAYVSNQSGRNEVYVRPLLAPGVEIQVSIDGGTEPVWGPNSRELFYRGGAAALPELMLAVIEGSGTPVVDSRRALFPVADIVTATPHSNYDVSPDGTRFAMVRNNASTRVMVIQNLPALVAKLGGDGRGQR